MQKWSKGKVRDKLNNQVLFDKATYDKLYKEVPQYKLITPSVVSERLKVRGSLARRALQELQQKGMIYFQVKSLQYLALIFIYRLVFFSITESNFYYDDNYYIENIMIFKTDLMRLIIYYVYNYIF